MTESRRNGFKQGILYIDNNEDSRRVITDLLGSAGYAVACARAVEEGLLLASLGWFDLIILEATYEDRSGLSLCKDIREFDSVTPILFFSNPVGEDHVREAHVAGSQYCLSKPLGINFLKQVVASLLSNGNAPTSINHRQLIISSSA